MDLVHTWTCQWPGAMLRGLGTSEAYYKQAWLSFHVSGHSVRYGQRSYYSKYSRPPQITKTVDDELDIKVDGGQGHNLKLKYTPTLCSSLRTNPPL